MITAFHSFGPMLPAWDHHNNSFLKSMRACVAMCSREVCRPRIACIAAGSFECRNAMMSAAQISEAAVRAGKAQH